MRSDPPLQPATMPNRPSRRLAAGLLVASCAAAALASCSGASEPPSPPPNPLAIPTAAADEVRLPEPTTADLLANALRADAVVSARVVWLGPAPGRPGNPCAEQGVTYQVVDVLGGSVAGRELRVAQPVCMGQPLVDNKAVGLSTAYFEPGRRFILFLERDSASRVRYAREDGGWASDYAVWDERVGTLPDDDAVRAQVQKAVATARKTKASGGDPFAGGRRRR